MIAFLISAIKIIVLLGFLITIHELGHFLIAKYCKVKVNEFSIGFGPTIWRKQGSQTKYSLRLIPLGGFVSMEGEDEKSEDKKSFSQASIPKRIAIVSAGAIVNILLGIILYFLVAWSFGPYISNEVGSVIDGYSAKEVDIQSGDKIIQINDKNIKSKYDQTKILEESNGEELKVEIERNEEIIEKYLVPTEVKSKVTGMYLNEKCEIVAVEKESVSEKQGLKANDEIIKINGVDINGDINLALKQINEEGVNTINIVVQRGNEQISVELTPTYISTYYLGVNFNKAPDTFINRCINSAMQTKEFAFSIIENLKELFSGKIGVDQMMGPVGISEVVAKTDGIQEFFEMMALISLSLGITNLLPIPALDGGKILILLIEAIRRKPLKEQTEINIQLLGFSILIALSIYITYNDILRIF